MPDSYQFDADGVQRIVSAVRQVEGAPQGQRPRTAGRPPLNVAASPEIVLIIGSGSGSGSGAAAGLLTGILQSFDPSQGGGIHQANFAPCFVVAAQGVMAKRIGPDPVTGLPIYVTAPGEQCAGGAITDLVCNGNGFVDVFKCVNGQSTYAYGTCIPCQPGYCPSLPGLLCGSVTASNNLCYPVGTTFRIVLDPPGSSQYGGFILSNIGDSCEQCAATLGNTVIVTFEVPAYPGCPTPMNVSIPFYYTGGCNWVTDFTQVYSQVGCPYAPAHWDAVLSYSQGTGWVVSGQQDGSGTFGTQTFGTQSPNGNVLFGVTLYVPWLIDGIPVSSGSYPCKGSGSGSGSGCPIIEIFLVNSCQPYVYIVENGVALSPVYLNISGSGSGSGSRVVCSPCFNSGPVTVTLLDGSQITVVLTCCPSSGSGSSGSGSSGSGSSGSGSSGSGSSGSGSSGSGSSGSGSSGSGSIGSGSSGSGSSGSGSGSNCADGCNGAGCSCCPLPNNTLTLHWDCGGGGSTTLTKGLHDTICDYTGIATICGTLYALTLACDDGLWFLLWGSSDTSATGISCSPLQIDFASTDGIGSCLSCNFTITP